jgi:hypothetical protein
MTELFLGAMLIFSTLIIMWMKSKIDKLAEQQYQLMDDLNLALKRENYLLKAMNDSMKVIDPKDFMIHRMRIAPKEFKMKTREEVNPDEISG